MILRRRSLYLAATKCFGCCFGCPPQYYRRGGESHQLICPPSVRTLGARKSPPDKILPHFAVNQVCDEAHRMAGVNRKHLSFALNICAHFQR